MMKRTLLIFGLVIAVADNIQAKWIFNFTRSLYVATMPENARGKVYAIPQDGKMGTYLPWSVAVANSYSSSNRKGASGVATGKTSAENGTFHQRHSDHQQPHQSLVRFRIVSGDRHNYFKAETEIVGDFAYLRIRTRSSLDVDLNRDLTSEYSLRIKAIYRRQAAGIVGGVGKNLETRTEVLLKITDQNDLSPVFLPEHYRAKIDRHSPVFSSLVRVTASDADFGLNGDVYYQLMNRTDFFTVHPTSGAVSLIRPLAEFPAAINNVSLSIAAVDRSSRLFEDSRSNQGLANMAKVDIDIIGEASTLSRMNNSTVVRTTGNRTDLKFRQCGSHRDSLCAVVSFSDKKVGPDYLEIDDDDAARLFYIERSDRRDDVDFEIRSVLTVPSGNYNFTLLPVGSNIMINVNASESAAGNLCADVAGAYLDIWMNKTEFVFELPEWAPNDFVIGRVPLHSEAGETRFELRKTEEEVEKNLPFYLTAKTGILYFHRNNNDTFTLNIKRRRVYEFFVHVRRLSCPDKEEKRKIIVRLKDCNTRVPVFADNCDRIIFDPDQPPSENAVVCKFVATDEDSGDNGRVSYDLIHDLSPAADIFHLDHDRGELTVKNSSAFFNSGRRDASKKDTKSFSFVVRASDHGWPLIRYSEKVVVVSFNGSAPRSGASDPWAVESTPKVNTPPVENRHDPSVASEWSFEVAENAPVGQRVGSIHAFDTDNGYAGVLLFGIDIDSLNSTMMNERPFDIDLYNGTLFVFGALDREKREEYSFRVSVRDLGSPSRRVFTKVSVKILDVNDNAPRFEKPSYRLRLKENTVPGTAVLKLKATDDDFEGNGRVRYTMITRTPYFSLNSTSGILTLTMELDREKEARHRLLVQAQDYGLPPVSTFVNVTVIVEDVNDNAPVCRSELLKAYVPEDYPTGALVTCVDAYDPDVGENGRISYRLVDATKRASSVNGAPFSIDLSTGCIRLSPPTSRSSHSNQQNLVPTYLELLLDYERQPFYNLTVELTDFGRPRALKSTCHVFVEVVDVNENRFPPKFLNVGQYDDDDEEPLFAIEAEIYENELAPTFVKQLKAVDPDAPVIMADSKPIYSIVDGDGLGIFTIDQDGRIFASRSLDRETKPYYWLTIVAQDRAAAPLSATLDVFVRVLDRNDNPPAPSKPIYYGSVMENSPPNVVVLRVDATDADFLTTPVPLMEGDEDDNENQEQETSINAREESLTSWAPLTYKITQGDPQSFFKIDPKTGYISTDRRSLNRETTPELELEVTISDDGEPEALASTVTVVIRVQDENDNAPAFPMKMMNYEIPERPKAKRGRGKGRNDKEMFLCRVFAFDEDEGENGEISYSIVEGNEQNLVRINSTTGSLFATENATWNDTHSMIFKIRATDRGTPPKYSERHVHLSVVSSGRNGKRIDSKSVAITSNLIDNPFHVAASDPIGHRVGLLEATVTDGGDGRRIWFYLLRGNDDDAFALRPDTGVILLAERPTMSSYTLSFLATFDGVTGTEGQAKIIVQQVIDDERPQFSKERIQIQVPENQRVNSLLLRLSEYLKSNVGHEEIRFFLSESYYNFNATHNGGNEGAFQVDPKSGAVYLKHSLDRERQSSYSFKVGARSRRGRRGYAIIDMQVSDVNDHTPKFINRHVQLQIAQTTMPGTVIHQLAAFDGDEGANGRLSYSLTLGTHKDSFAVDAVTGALRLLRPLTRSDASSGFVLSVKVEDGGRPALFDTADLRIVVIDNGGGSDGIVTNGVRFMQDLYSFRATEKFKIGSFIGHVQASGGGSVEYGILDDPGQYFYVHPLTGVITLRRAFDFEHSAHIEATVRAWGSSGIGGPAEDTARLVVTLSDGNGHEPVFKKLYYEAVVEENTPAGAVMLIVEATDEDTGQSGMVTYHIADQWASQYFEIDYHTGSVRLTRPLDYERADQRRFEFNVAAEDLGEPKLFAARPALVEIKVLDVNDLPPVFSQKVYEFVVFIPAVADMNVGRIEASDIDTVGTVQYFVRNPRTCWQIRIDTGDGMIRLSRKWTDLTSGTENSFSCTVFASDGVHETEANVNVKLSPYVEPASGLRFERLRYETAVPENSSDLAEAVTLLRLRTVGVGPDEPISFKLLNGDDESDADGPYFSLNPGTGVFTTTEYTRRLDRELTPNPTYIAEASLVRQADQNAARTLIVVRVLDKNDNEPKFVGLPYAISLPLETDANTTVFRVKAMDADDGINGKVKYSLAKDQRNSAAFAIDENSGEISLSKAHLLDESGITSFQLLVTASDSGSPALSTTASINVRLVEASAPIFPQYIYNATVMEGPPGVGTVLFASNSFGVSVAPNEAVGYSIVDENEDGLYSSYFDMDFATGRLILQKPLNRKTHSTLRLPIRVRDYGSSLNANGVQSYSDALVILHVSDYNDHAPVFEQPVYVLNISENASLGRNDALVTFKATDDDEGENAQITYFLKSNDDQSENYFRLNAETGALTLMKRLDFETQRKHTLTVVAKDFGVPSLSSTAKVHIHVLDINDNAPAFTQKAFDVELPSAKWSVGQFVGQALASDQDECDRGRLQYSIFSGNGGDWFSIDKRSGVLRTARSSAAYGASTPSPEYSLNLTVTDGVYSASCRFLIKIRSGSIADMAKFAKDLYHARVRESASPGTFVTEIRIDDKAGGLIPALRYRLVGSSLFRMEETTGKIFTSRHIGPREKAAYLLTIIAERWSDFTIVAHCRLQVTVISENNRPPKFLSDRFFAIVTPATKPNTIVLKIRAIDVDRDDVLEYSFDSKTSTGFEDYFFLDSNTGALAVRRSLDSVIGSNFKVDIRVTDRGNPPQRTTVPLEIRILSDTATASANFVCFSLLEYTFTAREDADIGTEIGQLDFVRMGRSTTSVTDDIRIYRFGIVTPRSTNEYINWISLGETTGILQVTERLDRESTAELQFYVSLFQTTAKETVAMALVRILIEDADDSGPLFENVDDEPVVVNVAEDAAVGNAITVFAASDRDSGEAGRVSYWLETLEEGTLGSLPFKIDAETGWLRTSSEVDRETRDAYSFKVVAGSSSTKELRTALNVTVKIADANDQNPVFEKREYDFRLEPSSSAMPGFVIGRVSASDADLPPNNEIRYYLIGGNERGLFDIRATGEIFITRKMEISDQTADYRLAMLATDGLHEDVAYTNVSFYKKSAAICVQKLASCPKRRIFNVKEDEPIGKVIGRLDLLPNGLIYDLVAENGGSKQNFDFLVKQNGDVIVSRSLDYEKVKSYNAEVGVVYYPDEKSLCGPMECVVPLAIYVEDVNDCPPEFDQDIPAEISLTENYSGRFPYLLGRVHAFDADVGPGGRVRYLLSMERKNEDEEENYLFTIDPNGGALFLWRPLDREHREMYNLTITATDGGNPKSLSSQKTIIVKVLDVNDNPPVFVQKSYDVSAPEDTPIGVVLLQVEAFSLDIGENAVITYSLEKSKDSETFEINERTGEVLLRQPLDYETAKERTVVLVATDGGEPPLSSTVQVRLRVIDVNDNDPIFERRHYTVRVQEDVGVGSRLTRLLATDLDSGNNGLVGYRIEPPNNYFQMLDEHKELGWITVAQVLDYEKTTRHEFQVVAYDHGYPPRSSVAVVTVEVLDVNDNQPRILNCNRTLTVKAHLSNTTPLLTFQATDADGPQHSKPFYFTIISTIEGKSDNDGPLFKLLPHGALYALRTPLELPEYYVQVSVRDSGDPPMSSQCRLHLRVTEESRFPPRMIDTSFMVLSYMGEMNSGGVIGRVVAVDDDPKDSIQYSISNVISVNDDNSDRGTDLKIGSLQSKETIFSIDPDDGRISAAAELIPGDYSLNVSATDGRFNAFAVIGITIRSITTKMLDSAVSIRVSERHDDGRIIDGRMRHGGIIEESFDERVFVERYLKTLTQAVASAVNARSSQYVHILSVQKATDSPSDEEDKRAKGGRATKKGSRRIVRSRYNTKRRSRRGDDANGQQRMSPKAGVDVLVAVQKSRHQDYFKPEYVRKTLEQKLEEVERKAGVTIVSLVTETCRPDRCHNGGICRERLHLYEMVNNAILTETFSFVSPAHKRWAECVCANGYGGEQCENELNECARKPCPLGHVCVASEKTKAGPRDKIAEPEAVVEQQRGYRCVCIGIGCPGFDSVHLLSPRSWIRYTLSENLEVDMRFTITFRTVARSGVLLYSGGGTDFQSLELFGGQLRYRYDLGDGEVLLYVDGRPLVDDGLWHTVRLERKGRMAKLSLDDREPQIVNAPGGAFVLNLHGADIYLGAGEARDSGFVGCLKDATLNDDVLPWQGPGVQLYDVDVGKCTDDDFKRLLTAVSGARNVCGWCLNNGTCISNDQTRDTSWSCLCPAPFTGLRCESLTTKYGATGACLSSPCRNGATCTSDKASEGGFRCQCPPNYSGRTCLHFGVDPCGSNPCANGGVCRKISSTNGGVDFICNCTIGWTGTLCHQSAIPSPNIVGGLWGVTVPELIGIVAIFLVLILLTVVIVLLCRRQRSFKRKKFMQRRGPSAGGNRVGENEPMFSESDVTPSTFAQRSIAGNMFVTGGPCGAMVIVSDPNSSITPMSPAACSAPGSFGNGGNGPPPLPPRSRGFQPHRGSKLSNLESALSTGIPTVQVRPLSMSERQTTPVEGGLSRATGGGYLETAANYGSAAEELERLGRRTSPSLDDLEDWKAALNRMNADSLEKLKEAAGITDEQWQNDGESGPDAGRSAGPPSSTGENTRGPPNAGRRGAPEDERSSGTYHWDYSDWNSTIGQQGRGAQADAGPYATLSHLSVATDDDYGDGTLPRGVCRLEETDSEYAANESGNEEHETETSSRLRGDEFTKEILALTRAFGRRKVDASESDDGPSTRPTLAAVQNQNGNNNGVVQSYLDRYLPRPAEPPNSTASERKLLLSGGGDTTTDEATSAAIDQFSDDDDEEFTTPSAVCEPSMLGASNISDIGGGASSDGERSTDSVVLASSIGGGVKREDSTLIVCSISDDEGECEDGTKRDKAEEDTPDGENSGNNNRTFLKKPKKQTQV